MRNEEVKAYFRNYYRQYAAAHREDPVFIAKRRESQRRHRAKVCADPELLAAARAKARQRNREHIERLRADPEAYAEFAARRRAYMRNYYRLHGRKISEEERERRREYSRNYYHAHKGNNEQP